METCMTFSIVARCPKTGTLGAAALSGAPGVSACLQARPWAVIALQGLPDPNLAAQILERASLDRRSDLHDIIQAALADDGQAPLRQVGIVDANGRVATYTGGACPDYSGDFVSEQMCVQGNVLTGLEVLEALGAAYWDAIDLPLTERLLRALEAGESAGGDRRGIRSAVLLTQSPQAPRPERIAVHEHADPLRQLRWLSQMNTFRSSVLQTRRT